ncbi:MAG: hypothetical protein V3V78_00425 [Candidatus Woesearchaeota archaeon]
MPTKENTIKWSSEEIKDILEREEKITIENLILSHYGVKAIVKKRI